MAIGVDTTGRKPRVTKNTPLFKFRNKVSLSVIGVGICFGLYMSFGSAYKKAREYILELGNDDDELRAERKLALMSSAGPRRTSAFIRELDDSIKASDRADS